MNRKLAVAVMALGISGIAIALAWPFAPRDHTPNLGQPVSQGTWKRSGDLILADDDVWSRRAPTIAAGRYDDGVQIKGAVASNPNDTPSSASANPETRGGKLLQAVVFVDSRPASVLLQDEVRRAMPSAGWTIAPDGMIAFVDAESHSDLMRWMWVPRGAKLPLVVVCRDGTPVTQPTTGFTTAQHLANWLNQQTIPLKAGFR